MVSSTYRAVLRRREEQQMTDTCVITRTIRSVDPDPQTGQHVDTPRVIYSGPCEFVAANVQAREAESAGRALIETTAVLKIPVEGSGSGDVAAGDTAVVLLDSHDPDSPPLAVRVTDGHHQTLAVSRRLPVKVIGNA